jgi:serine/threonine protein kinase
MDTDLHVPEQEIINYPSTRQVHHLGCRRVREQDIEFDSHMSGFVYKVHVNGETLIKKEIPGPDTVDEFLYEINALNRLRYSNNVIRFYGVVVDDQDEYVKGLLISYADQGALIDVIYDNRQDHEHGLPWPTREKWARQIVHGLSDIHESGFVQGDFTLSNIVIDDMDDAKIIDINRRGCPVGWEPPEATPLIECSQRISMYIGVKSDLYQLGMVLWALATQEDEPEAHGRPLLLGPEVDIPDWYRQMVEICLSEDPRYRVAALSLLSMFPDTPGAIEHARHGPPSISVNDSYSYFGGGYHASNAAPRIVAAEPSSDWSYVNLGPTSSYVDPSMAYPAEQYYYTRGRSPPSPLPSNYGRCDSPGRSRNIAAWAAAHGDIAPSYSDVGHDETDQARSATPTTNKESLAAEPYDDQIKQAQPRLEESETQATARDHTPTAEALAEPCIAERKKEDDIHLGNTALASSDIQEAVNSALEAPEASAEDVTAGREGVQLQTEVLASQEQPGITAPESQIGSIQDIPNPASEPEAAPPPRSPVLFLGEATPTQPEPAPGSTPMPAPEESGPAEGPIDLDAEAREATPRPPSPPPRFRDSPVAAVEEPPELKGVGAAYDGTDYQTLRPKMSLDDLETAAPAAPAATHTATITTTATTEAQK